MPKKYVCGCGHEYWRGNHYVDLQFCPKCGDPNKPVKIIGLRSSR